MRGVGGLRGDAATGRSNSHGVEVIHHLFHLPSEDIDLVVGSDNCGWNLRCYGSVNDHDDDDASSEACFRKTSRAMFKKSRKFTKFTIAEDFTE
jgi:hypothetical protein